LSILKVAFSKKAKAQSDFGLSYSAFEFIRGEIMKTKFLLSALLICLSGFGLQAAAQTKQPYLERYLNVEDAANGYMSGAGDAAQDGFAMALFKRANGTYLIAFYTYGEGGVEDTPWCVFLDYKNGKWTDVSRAVVPNYNAQKYIYELPRQGTTIEVFGKDEMGEGFYKGKKLYDLIWQNGKFSVKR
jgi:hypothetical protein